jgi:hypothetical protein
LQRRHTPPSLELGYWHPRPPPLYDNRFNPVRPFPPLQYDVRWNPPRPLPPLPGYTWVPAAEGSRAEAQAPPVLPRRRPALPRRPRPALPRHLLDDHSSPAAALFQHAPEGSHDLEELLEKLQRRPVLCADGQIHHYEGDYEGEWPLGGTMGP